MYPALLNSSIIFSGWKHVKHVYGGWTLNVLCIGRVLSMCICHLTTSSELLRSGWTPVQCLTESGVVCVVIAVHVIPCQAAATCMPQIPLRNGNNMSFAIALLLIVIAMLLIATEMVEKERINMRNDCPTV
jgi:hypothetical protein